jgi:hypothetical protein
MCYAISHCPLPFTLLFPIPRPVAATVMVTGVVVYAGFFCFNFERCGDITHAHMRELQRTVNLLKP